MPFTLMWVAEARSQYDALREAARKTPGSTKGPRKGKSSKAEGLFKQVAKTLARLAENPRHPGLHTHEYTSLEHPFKKGAKVWEAYVQNNTPGAYRLFWCYGPEKDQITIITITPHP